MLGFFMEDLWKNRWFECALKHPLCTHIATHYSFTAVAQA